MKEAKRTHTAAAGFTLVEIMIVLAIFAGILVLGVPRLVRPNEQNLIATLRHMIVLSKEVRNKARINGSTYRIAIRMDEREGHAYWVERGPGEVLITAQAEDESDQEDEEQPSRFQTDTSIMREPRVLPDGYYFGGVDKASGEESQDISYIHFFSQGVVEEAVIYVTNRQNLNWTLSIHPLTGRMDVIKDNVTLDQLRN